MESVFAARERSFAGPQPKRRAIDWSSLADGRAANGEIELDDEEMADFIAFAYLNFPFEFWPLRLFGKRVVFADV